MLLRLPLVNCAVEIRKKDACLKFCKKSFHTVEMCKEKKLCQEIIGISK